MAKKVALPSNYSLELSTDDGSTWNAVPGLTTFDPGDDDVELVDVTDFDSAQNRREYASGLIAAGDGTFEVHYDQDNAVHQTLRTKNGGAAVKLRETDSDEYIIYDAIISGWGVPKRIGEKMVGTVTFRRTGAVAYSAVA